MSEFVGKDTHGGSPDKREFLNAYPEQGFPRQDDPEMRLKMQGAHQ
jgi:hypothetical protein